MKATFGDAAKSLIKQRGRWQSDIAEQYQRTLLTDHVNASTMIGGAAGADLEAICEGWAQPI